MERGELYGFCVFFEHSEILPTRSIALVLDNAFEHCEILPVVSVYPDVSFIPPLAGKVADPDVGGELGLWFCIAWPLNPQLVLESCDLT